MTRLDIGTFVEYRMADRPAEERIRRAMGGPGRSSEPCACGGVIEANEPTWEAVAGAVLAHGRGPRHCAWRLGVQTVGDL